MKLLRLSLLLLLIYSGGATAHSLPKDSSETICFTIAQFKFYAVKVIENKGLKLDTAILNGIINSYVKVVADQQHIIANDSLIQIHQTEIIKIKIKDFEDLLKKYVKELKKNKRLKTVSLVAIFTSLILAIIVIIK